MALIYGTDFMEPTSALRLRFPFQPEASGAILSIAREAELSLERPEGRYRIAEGRLELEAVRIEGEHACLQGTFEGRLEEERSPTSSQDSGWQQTLYLGEGRFRIVRAIVKSALPGARPPQPE